MFDPLLHIPLRKKIATLATHHANGALQPFEHRFHANLYRIRELFFRLYGGRDDCDEQFWLLVEDLIGAFDQRPQALKEVDLIREKDPFWLLSEKWVGMMLYVDRFAGHLRGVKDNIFYFEELGVNWVHMMPIFSSPPGSNDGGYAVSDYRTVDERFGTNEDLIDLLSAFRKLGILSTLDLIMNHTSDQHQWAVKARNGDQAYQDFYYLFPDRSIPDQFEHGMPEIFPHTSPGNFTFVPELGQHVMTVFHDYQWDLNYTNPRVFREMLSVSLFLANLGVDILRLDAVAFTWKRIGTTCQNLPEAHIILQLLKACAQVVAPGTAFIAEAIVAPHEVIRYFGEGDARGKECDIAYHATCMALLWDALATGEVHLLNKGLKGIPGKPHRTTWINYLRCHDDIGLGFDEQHLHDLGKHPASHKQFLVDYYSGRFPGSTAKGAPFAANTKTGDARISGSLAALTGLEYARETGDSHLVQEAIRKGLMLHAVILSYGGLPLLYYGDEIGLGNDYSYLQNPDQAYDNRWMHRPVIDWDQADERHHPGTVEQQMFDGLRRLILLRQASPEFADHNSCSVEDSHNQAVFAFLRWNDSGARTMVLANMSAVDKFVGPEVFRNCGIQPKDLHDKITGRRPEVAEEGIRLPSYKAAWLSETTTFQAFQVAKEVKKLMDLELWKSE